MDQVIIKAVLIAMFLLFALVLIRSSSSARSQAIRSLGLGIFLIAAIIAVLFPALVNSVATFLGVGRGTDLLLYSFIVVFIGHVLSTNRKRRVQDAQLTALARTIALQSPLYPDTKIDS